MDDRKSQRPDMKPQAAKSMRLDKAQNMFIENRERITLTGVLNVETFTEQEVFLETSLGMLTVKGTSMHMNKLNLETGDLVIDGQINSCTYSDKQDFKTKGAGFFSKLFK